MKKLTVLILTFSLFACNTAENTSAEEWMPLFLKDAEGWFKSGDAQWSFQNDELSGVADSTSGFVITKEKFGDFHLSLEFFPDSTVNSGVFIRCGEEMSPKSCYEINIWDNHPNPDYRTGAVVTLSKPLAYVKTNGKWNTYEIKVKQDHLQAWINGQKVADLRDSLFQTGTIGLQTSNTGTVRFKNVKVKPL